MVASMAQAAAASYYMESQRSFRHPTEYYTAGTEPDGVWFNPNDLLGLADGKKIDSKHFLRLYGGFAPETGEKLTQNAGSDRRSPGLDITFSPDKSVSALWAIAGDDLRTKIENAHNRAARMALQEIFLKECSYTRTRVGGTDGDIHVLPAHLLGAMFQHGTSRADDPQLHTHCVIFNAVQTEQDGKWRALHQKPLYNWVRASGFAYDAYLASSLTELGIKMERHGKDNAFVRIKNMPKDLEKLWSKRRSEIVEAAAEMGFETGDNSSRAEMINLMTRQRKRTDQEPEQRHARWREEGETLYECAAILASVFEETEEVTQERIREWTEKLDELPHVLTRLQAVFRTPELAEAIYKLHHPALGTLHPETIESAIQRILRNPELVALDREPRTPEAIAGLSHTVPLSTRHTLEMEQETRDLALAMSQRSAFALPANAIEEKLQQLKAERYPLSDEQTSAIRYVTGRAGGISIVEGAAGSGKTTTMRPIVDLYKQHGYNFVAAAIAWRTAVELANDCAIAPYSCDKLLKDASRGKLHLDQKSIVIVEEAGMISTRHTNRILKLAQQSGAKLIFLGDTQQQQPIEAGPGLRLVHDVTGSHRVDTMRRQLPDAEDYLRDIHGLDPADAIAQAARLTPEQEREAFLPWDPADPEAPVKPWQIEASRNFKDGNAKDAIEAYRLRGRIHLRSSPDATVDKLVDDWHRYVTENPDKSSLVLARTHREIRLLSERMRERIHAGRDDGKSAVITVSRGEGRKREYYDLEIRTGDVLRIGGGIPDRQIFTGTLVTVEDLSVQGAPAHHEPRVLVTARDDRGRRLTFYHDEIRDYYGNIRLDHGFALTMTAAQGLTVNRAFVLADDAPARETIYPAATRHRDRLDFYVSRDGPLSKIKVSLPDQGAALEEPLTDDDILDHLAKRWSRHQPKEAATDFASPELMQETLDGLRRSHQTPSAPPGPDRNGEGSEDRPPAQTRRRAAVNDNAGSLSSWAGRQLRGAALNLRYGNTAALVSQGRREVAASYDHLRERARKEGAGVELSPEFANTLFRQAQVLAAAAPFRRDPARFRDLLRRRGGIEPQDLDDFAAQFERAKEARRAALNPARRRTAAAPDPAPDIPGDEALQALLDPAAAPSADEAALPDDTAFLDRPPPALLADMPPDLFADVPPPDPHAETAPANLHDHLAPADMDLDLEAHRARSAAAPPPGLPEDAPDDDRPAPQARHESARQSRSLPSAAEVSARLAAAAEDVCRRYLPDGAARGAAGRRTWQAPGPGPGPAPDSLQVHLAGPNRGKWLDSSTGERGDLIDLIRRTRGYGSIGQALKEAGRFLDPAPARPSLDAPSTSPDERAAASARQARALLDSAEPVRPDDPAGRYLAGLGLGLEDAGALRYSEHAWHLVGDDLRRSPALLAPLTTPDGSLRGLERLLLTPGGQPLPMEPPANQSRASAPDGAATWLGRRGAPHAALCRSLPDALALLHALDAGEREQVAVAALPEGCDPARLALPPNARDVFLVEPPGTDAERTWQAFRAAHPDNVSRLQRIVTGDAGLAPLLQGQRREALRGVLRPLAETLAEARRERQDLAALERFSKDWNWHATHAAAGRIHPFYLHGHGELVERLRALRERPAVTALPAEKLAPLDAILHEDARQAAALATVERYMKDIRTLRVDRHALSDDQWRDAAERLLAQAHAIDRDPETYGPCLNHTYRAWQHVEYGIRDLASDLGRPGDSLRHRHPELRLAPIPRTVPFPEEALAADAAYRLLRDRWHERLAMADARGLHPSALADTPSAIDAMRELRARPGLHPAAHKALDALLAHHDGYVETRDGIALFRKDWQQHLDLAEAVHAHPRYIDGHDRLLERARALLDHPAATSVPAAELRPLEAVLDQARRQAAALTAVEDYIARLKPCLDDLFQLERAARRQGARLDSLPSYAAWRETAEPLLEQGEAIAGDRDTYGPCLDHTFLASYRIHDGIRDLAQALGRKPDSLLDREPELFLEPVTRSPIFLDEPKQDDADYRRLADRWHALMALADEHRIHPFRIQDCDALVDAMRDLRERPNLDARGRRCLDRIVKQHSQFHVDRVRVQLHLDDTNRAVRRLRHFENLSQIRGRLDTNVEGMRDYPDWKERAAELLSSGRELLADPERYGIHLKQNPDNAERIRANIRTLDAHLNPKAAPPPRQQPQEDIKQTETQTQTIRRSRGIRP